MVEALEKQVPGRRNPVASQWEEADCLYERKNHYNLPIQFHPGTMAGGTRFFKEGRILEKGGVHSRRKKNQISDKMAVLI